MFKRTREEVLEEHEVQALYVPNATVVTHPCDTTGYTQGYGMVQGTSHFTRRGKAIRLLSLSIVARIYNNSSAGGNLVYLGVIWDRFPNGNPPPAPADLFNSGYAYSHLVHDPRYIELWHKRVYLEGHYTGGAANGWSKMVEAVIPLDGYIQHYGDNPGSPVPQKGGLYLVFFGINATGSTAASATYTSRLDYVDT